MVLEPHPSGSCSSCKYAGSCTPVARVENSSHESSRTHSWQRVQKPATTYMCTQKPWTRMTTESKRQFQKFRKGNSNWIELQTKTLDTSTTCYDPQLQRFFMWPLGHRLCPLAATSLDHMGTLVHRRPTHDKTDTPHQEQTEAHRPNRVQTSRDHQNTIPGIQKSPKTEINADRGNWTSSELPEMQHGTASAS